MCNYILAQRGDESSAICSSSQEAADKKIQLIHTLFHLSIMKLSTPTGGRIERERPLCSARSVALDRTSFPSMHDILQCP